MSRRGLHNIGRHQSINVDNPPSESEDEEQAVDDFLKEYEQPKRSYRFEEGHEFKAESALAQKYRVFNPGGHTCFQSATNVSNTFTHCAQSVVFAQRYAHLRHLLQTRARLEFQRECVLKLRQSSTLVSEIEATVQDEADMLDKIYHQTLQSSVSTKLDNLHLFCDELRISINHWTSIKQHLLQNKWLRSQLPALTFDLDALRSQLHGNVINAMCGLERLCRTGFKVLANCDDFNVSQGQLWKIARGLEEYNSLCRLLKSHPAYRQKHRCTLSLKVHEYRQEASVHAYLARQNFGLDVCASFKPVSLSKVLSMLARERSHIAATVFHHFVTSQPNLLARCRTETRGSISPWFHCPSESAVHSLSVQNGDFRSVTPSDVIRSNTDKTADSVCCVTDASIVSEDLSESYSILSDFASRTQEFATTFLQVISQSTQLLSRSSSQSGASNSQQLQISTLKRASLEAFNLKNSEEFSRNLTSSPSLRLKPDLLRLHERSRREDDDISLANSDVSFLSSTRKVKWGDEGEASQVRYVAEKVLRQVWRYFEAEVEGCFLFPVVTSASEASGQVGSVAVCGEKCSLVLVKSLQLAENSGIH